MSSLTDNISDAFLVAGGIAVVAAIGPRFVQLRALSIALRSKFVKAKLECLQVDAVKALRRRITEERNFGQNYLVVTGQHGVGKSCVIDAATSNLAGVVKVTAFAGNSTSEIIEKTFLELASPTYTFFNLSCSAPRVIFWHRLFTLGYSPIVVIKTYEPTGSKDYSNLTSAVRTLAEHYKLRVIVDGTNEYLDDSLFRTYRQIKHEVEPMNKEMIWQMSQCQELFKRVKEAGLDETVFPVLGGIPVNYAALWTHARYDLMYDPDANPRNVIGNLLCDAIFKAMSNIQRSRERNSAMNEIIKSFDKETNSAPFRGHVRGRVFREGELNGFHVLVPATNAIGLVLRHNIRKCPTLDELEALIKLDALKSFIQ